MLRKASTELLSLRRRAKSTNQAPSGGYNSIVTPTKVDAPLVVTIHDPFGNLPTEILFVILDYIQLDNSHAHTLRALSSTCRSIHNIVTPILWKCFTINDSGGEGGVDLDAPAAQWRLHLARMTIALTSNKSRAAHVKRLSIILAGSLMRWRFYGGAVVKQLRGALYALPNLKALQIRIHHKDPNLIAERLSSMLDTSNFPFILTELQCSSSLEPFLVPFIHSQPSIERFSIAMDVGYHWYEGVKAYLNRARTYKGLLPKLKRFIGPPTMVRTICLGHRLESLEVQSGHASHDIDQSHEPLYLPPQSIFCQPRTVTLTLLEQRHLPENIGDHLLGLLSNTYSIFLPSIRHLRVIVASGKLETPPFTGFPASMLAKLDALETIEWSWSIAHRDETEPYWNGWCRSFVLSCEAFRPSLRRISLMSGQVRTVEFVRIQGRLNEEGGKPLHKLPHITWYADSNQIDGTVRATWMPQPSVNDALLELDTGSIWSIHTDLPWALGPILNRNTRSQE
ncbi:hypothetical protein DL93DRAFT_2081609 [Clavulina sp. PMI_390]|nr:hypothetical protein DL93DRAFT_2081609 [Clavulina sp. PMI_390]